MAQLFDSFLYNFDEKDFVVQGAILCEEYVTNTVYEGTRPCYKHRNESLLRFLAEVVQKFLC